MPILRFTSFKLLFHYFKELLEKLVAGEGFEPTSFGL